MYLALRVPMGVRVFQDLHSHYFLIFDVEALDHFTIDAFAYRFQHQIICSQTGEDVTDLDCVEHGKKEDATLLYVSYLCDLFYFV